MSLHHLVLFAQHQTVNRRPPNRRMADDALIRRQNLRRLLSANQWLPGQLHQHAGYGRESYWHDLCRDDKKSFGERAARRLEEALGLPRQWLDHDHADVHLFRSSSGVREKAVSMPPSGWPWSPRLWSHVTTLDDDEIARAELLLRAHWGIPPDQQQS